MTAPLEDLKRISSAFGISLKVKRDDLYPFTGGGNKARKIKYILQDAEQQGANALVTAGAANSNHARVVAIAGARAGWPVHIIIHDKEDYSKGNLQLMKLAGAKLIFVEQSDVSKAMDTAMDELTKKGHTPYYIFGGGHTVHGMTAYYEAVKEFMSQSEGWVPDYVIHASGTGGTQAGLHVGFSEYFPKTEVLGISVARDKKRGREIVRESVSELCSYLDVPEINNKIFFFDNWTGGGYENVYPVLIDSIKKAAELDGLITDPTYTGKALTALFEMCKNGRIQKGSRVLFWHTGGTINLLKYNHLL